MSIEDELTDNQPDVSCRQCHRTLGQGITTCPNCSKDIDTSQNGIPLALHLNPANGTHEVSSKLDNFLIILSRTGIGFFSYIVLFILSLLGEIELSKRYMPPNSGQIDIILWIIILTLTALPIYFLPSWYRAIESKSRLGIRLGTILGFLLVMILWLLLLQSRDWRMDSGN